MEELIYFSILLKTDSADPPDMNCNKPLPDRIGALESLSKSSVPLETRQDLRPTVLSVFFQLRRTSSLVGVEKTTFISSSVMSFVSGMKKS